MKRILALFLLAAVVAPTIGWVESAGAQGQPFIVQTKCETLATTPPTVRVTFGVGNNGSIPICSVHLTPISSGPTPVDSCRILECSSPPGWFCAVDTLPGSAAWRVLGSPCIEFGQKHDGFDIILDPLFCCYRAEFDNDAGQIFYTTQVCFECEKPTSTDRSTWGRIKIHYR